MVKIEVNPDASLKSMKEARNGNRKWKHSHLPDPVQTESPFKNVVVPHARKKAGMLIPWGLPSVKDLQEIVNEVFPGKEYTVTPNNVWYMLVSRCALIFSMYISNNNR